MKLQDAIPTEAQSGLFAAAKKRAAQPGTRGDAPRVRSETSFALPLSRLRLNPKIQARFVEPTPAEIATRVQSIRDTRARGGGVDGSGITKRLLVVPASEEGLFDVIAGGVNFRALRAIEEATPGIVDLVPVELSALSSPDEQLLESYADNDAGVPFKPLDRGHVARQLVEEFGYTQGDAARKMSMALSTFRDYLKLAGMDSDIQSIFEVRSDAVRIAQSVNKIAPNSEFRAEIIKRIKSGESYERIKPLIDQHLDFRRAREAHLEINRRAEAESRAHARNTPTANIFFADAPRASDAAPARLPRRPWESLTAQLSIACAEVREIAIDTPPQGSARAALIQTLHQARRDLYLAAVALGLEMPDDE